MTENEIGAMYGCEGRYFDALPEGFENYVWIELIGFDNGSEDYGVANILNTMGYTPQAMLLLVTSVDFVHMHRGCDREYTLDPYFCSYAGHPCNDERKRQVWTNFQVRGLVETLHAFGIRAYISMFDLLSPNSPVFTEHPELQAEGVFDGKLQKSGFVYMTKRFSDGRYYQDYFLEKALEVLKDYGFDGIHLADGICRPRLPLQWMDYSDDMLSQAGIEIPADCDRSAYILTHYREKWLSFCTDRWMGFLEKVIAGFDKAGYSVIVNSCWTKDPMEALYRYGVDYNRMAKLPITAMVVENGGPTLEILDHAAMAGYRQSYEDRKLVHHYLRASLFMISACVRKRVPLRPLFPVRDTMEQYDVIHHMPTALQRHGASLFANFLWNRDGSLSMAISGHTYCLGDGLSHDNWRYLRLCSDNGYHPSVYEACGVTVIWSDERNLREVEALILKRTWSTTKWVAELLRRGAAISKVAHIDCLEAVKGTILVTNPQLLTQEELERIKAYRNGEVIYLSAPEEAEDYGTQPNPIGVGFPYPLFFAEVDEKLLTECVERINHGRPYISEYCEECHVQEIKTGVNTSRFLIDNEEYYYTVPVVHTGRRIRSAVDITKNRGYEVRTEDDTFRTLVPLRGVAIVEVEFGEADE